MSSSNELVKNPYAAHFPFSPVAFFIRELNGSKLATNPQNMLSVVQEWVRVCAYHDRLWNFGWLTPQAVELLVKLCELPYVTPTDIELLCAALTSEDIGTQRQNSRTPAVLVKSIGYTLSALINLHVGSEQEVHLDISHLSAFGYLAGLRSGTVHIHGVNTVVEQHKNTAYITSNLSHHVGVDNDGATIIIYGNCIDSDIGFRMKGGRIIVRGNAAGTVFRCMRGGEGVVTGNVTNACVAPGMEGGIVRVLGNVTRNPTATGDFSVLTAGHAGTGGKVHIHGEYEELPDAEKSRNGCIVVGHNV